MALIIDGRRYEEKTTIEPISYKAKTHYDLSETSEGELQVKETTELGDALENLNRDTMDAGRMSGIDLRARLHYAELSAILAVDSLIDLKFLPVGLIGFTRQKKRLSVSLDGEGRREIVQIVGGKQEIDSAKSGGIGGFFRGMMGGNKNEG